MSNVKRRVCVVLVDRANYGRMKPVMEELRARPGIELQIVCAGSMVLERFDRPVRLVREHGFETHGEIYLELEGSTPATMAKSVGFGVVEFASEFQRLRPDVVLLIGDRYEALSAVIAAAYMNLTIVHLQGGEVSGSIDESARHAITKFAHFHFPATDRAREYVLRMGEREDTVLGVGCPSSDIAAKLDRTLDADVLNSRGAGAFIDPTKPFMLSIFHPTTSEFGSEEQQMKELLFALHSVGMPTLVLWPNIDAGSNQLSKTIRAFREQHAPEWLRVMTNLSPENFLKVLGNATCAVGNSSSFVRDAGYFGTPVVSVGNRQQHREHDVHVTEVPAERRAIADAVQRQVEHGRYPRSTLYGDGAVAKRIADALESLTPYVQKCLSFPEADGDARLGTRPDPHR